jgi:ubiquinone/menaquinone biosynthesis C-methylase UbiE
LSHDDCVPDIGCGTGRNFPHLREAVGSSGRIYGIDISRGMLRKAQQVRDDNGWQNITLTECGAAEYGAPEPLDAVLFSLLFNTMPRGGLWACRPPPYNSSIVTGDPRAHQNHRADWR